jgi:hypothetical protein
MLQKKDEYLENFRMAIKYHAEKRASNSVSHRCVDLPDAAPAIKHQVIEHNFQHTDVDDNYIVLLNIKSHVPVIAFKIKDKWYSDWDGKELEVPSEDIISFMELPYFGFFKKR